MINNRQNGRRRGRGGAQVRNGGGGPERGNRIDNRSRGNAAQLLEKYKNLARDAQMQGDRVMTEYYLQFADHYFRVLGESRQRFEDQNQHRRQRDDFDFDDGDESENGEGETAVTAPEERRERAPRPQPQPQPNPQQSPRVEYGVEGEKVQAGEDDGRRRRNRRNRRPDEEGGSGGEAPRIEVERLPPAFAATEGEAAPAPRVRNSSKAGAEPVAEAAAGEVALTDAEDAPAKPARRRTRRVKTEEETGDSSVAA